MDEIKIITEFGVLDDGNKEPYVSIELADDTEIVLSANDADALAFNLIVSAHKAREFHAIMQKYGGDSNEQVMANTYYKTLGAALNDGSTVETSPE